MLDTAEWFLMFPLRCWYRTTLLHDPAGQYKQLQVVNKPTVYLLYLEAKVKASAADMSVLFVPHYFICVQVQFEVKAAAVMLGNNFTVCFQFLLQRSLSL